MLNIDYRKNLHTRKIAVIVLKLEQYHFTTEQLAQKMQIELQKV